MSSIPGQHSVHPLERYLASISPPSARGVKQGCRLCTHAFKIMHGRKRTWMTKRKSRDPETDRWCWHAQTPKRRNVAAYGRAIRKRSHSYFLLATDFYKSSKIYKLLQQIFEISLDFVKSSLKSLSNRNYYLSTGS